jgi:hypothetical protein
MSEDKSGDKKKLELNIEEQETLKKPRQSNDPRDYLVPGLVSRDDPKWNWLRNLGTEGVAGETVFGKVHQYVELPYLGHEFLPDNLGKRQRLKQVFITLHRAKILKTMWETLHLGVLNVKSEDSQAGCILSGPYGIGKTMLSYLMVCAAYVNKAIIIYFPLSMVWIAPVSDVKIYQCFLKRFLRLNADLAAELSCRKHPIVHDNLFQLARAGLESDDLAKCRNVCETLMEELSLVTKYPVLYAIDEHHEIWKVKKQDHHFIRHFTISTGLCAGSRTFLLISTSVLSHFDFHMQPGLERWLVRVQPFDLEAFRLAVSADPSSENFALPKSLLLRHLNVLYEATGGLPEEIGNLREYLTSVSSTKSEEPSIEAVMQWIEKRCCRIDSRVCVWLQEHKTDLNSWRISLNNLIRNYLDPENFPRVTRPLSESICDSEFVYFNETQRSWKLVNFPVFRVLHQFYHYKWQQDDLSAQPLFVTGYDKKHKMYNIKERTIDQFANAVLTALMSKINDTCIIRAMWAVPGGDDKAHNIVNVVLPHCVKMRPFDLNIPRDEATLPIIPTIFVPQKSNSMAFDAILCYPSENMHKNNSTYKIVFVQISLNESHHHEKKFQTFKKAFGLLPEQKELKKELSKETQSEEILEEDKQVSQEDLLAVKILRWLTKNDNLSIKLSDDSRHWEVNGWQESFPLKIEVIYITAQKKAVVRYWCRCRGGPRTGNSDPTIRGDYLPFVKIITREECIRHFDINFVTKDVNEVFTFNPNHNDKSGLHNVHAKTRIATESKTTCKEGQGKEQKYEDEELGPFENLEVSDILQEEEDLSSDGEDNPSSDGEDDLSNDGEDDLSSDGEDDPSSDVEADLSSDLEDN